MLDTIMGKKKSFNKTENSEELTTPIQEESSNIGEKVGINSNMPIEDLLAPIDMEVDFNHLEMGGYFFRTLFVSGYPRFVGPNWLSPIINFEHSLGLALSTTQLSQKRYLKN